MLEIAFILGRPGSGKSTTASLIRMLASDHGWLTYYMNDYEHLQKMFLHEEAQNISFVDRDFILRELDGCIGFDVKNFEVLRTVLKEMRKEVDDIKDMGPQSQKTICTVEFARANYQDALELFGNKILSEAHLLYLNVDVEICVERNHNRTDHFISDEIMASYYSSDDWSRELYNLHHGCDKFELKNIGTFEDLDQKVEEWFESHLLKRVSDTEAPGKMM